MLVLDLDKSATKFIKHLPPKHARQMLSKALSLTVDPYPNDARPLFGFPYWRVDSGEYRIVYKVAELLLIVRIIGKRNDDEVYRRLKRLEG